MKCLTFGSGPASHSIAFGRQLHIGSGSHNGLVLPSNTACSSHALVRLVGEGAVIEDLGSRGGTWLDGRRIEVPTRWVGPCRIGDVTLHLQACEVRPSPPIFLEEVATRIRHPLTDGSFVIGETPGADIRVPGAAPAGLVLQQGALRLGDRSLPLPWEGRLGGIEVRLLRDLVGRAPTPAPLHLQVGLLPPTATISDAVAEHAYTMHAPNRVALLYFLAAARRDDLAEGIDDERVGWRSDEDVSVAVWGRGARHGSRNRLNTLAYRVRGELGDNDLPSSMIEKMPGWMRLQPCTIELDPQGSLEDA